MERRLFGKILCLSLFTKTIPNVFAREARLLYIVHGKCIGCGSYVNYMRIVIGLVQKMQ